MNSFEDRIYWTLLIIKIYKIRKRKDIFERHHEKEAEETRKLIGKQKTSDEAYLLIYKLFKRVSLSPSRFIKL